VGWDVYKYGWGSKREVGLGSTEFAAAVTVDVAATALLPAAGAAVGTIVCGPGAPICVAIGIAAGSGLNVAFSHSGVRERSIEALSGLYEAILQTPYTISAIPEETWYDWPNIPGP